MCKPIFHGYVGGKKRYVRPIRELFDESCSKYIEPFAGSAAVFFSFYKERYLAEIINERNLNIANLYDLFANEESRAAITDELLRIRIPHDELQARGMFRDAKLLGYDTEAKLDDVRKQPLDSRIKKAAGTFFRYSFSYNGSGESYSAQKYSDGELKSRIIDAFARFDKQLSVRVECMDGLELLKNYKQDAQFQIFVDPPYVGQYRSARNLYKVEMNDIFSHIQLAKVLNESNAAVVLCGYRSGVMQIPTVYDAYLDNDWHCLKLAEVAKSCEVVRKGQAKQRGIEFVWTNRMPKHAKIFLSEVDYKEKITEADYWDKMKEAIRNGVLSGKNAEEYKSAFYELYGKKLE